MLIPFTADLHLEGKVSGIDQNSCVDYTRNYWSQVTSNFMKEPEERKKDPYFVFFTDYILRKLEKREEDARFYENFPKLNNLVMIDTVISGKASSTILRVLDSLAKDKNIPGLFPYNYLFWFLHQQFEHQFQCRESHHIFLQHC